MNNISNHPAPNLRVATFAASAIRGVHHSLAPRSRRSIRSCACIYYPRRQPPALDRLAGPRPRFTNDLRPRLHGVQNRDLALLPPAIAPHPQVQLEEAAAVAWVGQISVAHPALPR